MKKLVIIGMVIPEPASTAAGIRMMQLISLFLERGYEIIFLTTAQNTEFSEKIKIQQIDINDSSFDEIIQKISPDVVLFDRYITEEQFGWRVAESCPNAMRILDTEDLHFLREARRKSFHQPQEEIELQNDIFFREIASILKCDLTLIISKKEMEILTQEFNIRLNTLFYLPFLEDSNPKENPNFESRKNFVSIGNFLHDPNWQTVKILKQYWKKIRHQLPNAELHIYGAYTPKKAFDLHKEKEGFLVKGRAESSKKTLQKYRILLAPIPYGAGLKGKLWESMKYGIPSITTSIGAEAMHENLPWNGCIEDTETGFVEKAIALYQNPEQWKNDQDNGYQILKKVYSKHDFVNPLWEKIDFIFHRIHLHRKENYLGLLLQKQQYSSTKYMSKWIEEKNRY